MARAPEKDQREGQDDEEEEPGKRRAGGHVLEGEERLVDVDVHEVRRSGGPAVTPVEDEGHEEVLEHANCGERDAVEDDGGHQRKRHVPQLAPPAGAVDAGSVVELAGHVLEPCDVDDDRAPDTPDPDENQRGVDPVRIVDPVTALEADEVEEPVDPAGLRIEHPRPCEQSGHERNDERHEEERLEVARPAQRLAVEHEGDGERYEQTNRQRYRSEPQGGAERVPGLGVAEHLLVVLEADEPERLVAGERDVGECEDQRGDHGDGREQRKADQPRRDEEVSPDRLHACQAEPRLAGVRRAGRLELHDRHLLN